MRKSNPKILKDDIGPLLEGETILPILCKVDVHKLYIGEKNGKRFIINSDFGGWMVLQMKKIWQVDKLYKCNMAARGYYYEGAY